MGAQPGTLQVGADRHARWSPPRSRPTSSRRRRPSPRRRRGSRSKAAAASRSPARRPTAAAARSRRRRSVGRRRHHLAQGRAGHARPGSIDWTPGAARHGDDSQPRDRRQRQPRDRGRRRLRVTVVAGNCPCTTLWKPSIRCPGHLRAPPTAARTSSASSSRSDIDGFITGVRFYKGPAQHRHAPRQPVDGERHAAGDRHVHQRDADRLAAGALRHAGRRSRRTRPTSRRITPTSATTRSTPAYFVNAGIDSPPLHALPNRTKRRQRRLRPTAQRRSRPRRSTPPTTGSTSCSRQRRETDRPGDFERSRQRRSTARSVDRAAGRPSEAANARLDYATNAGILTADSQRLTARAR